MAQHVSATNTSLGDRPTNAPSVKAFGKNDGEEEYVKWVAEKLGIPVKNVASVEMFSSCDGTYDIVTRYLTLVAVDSTGPAPKKVDPLAENPDSPGTLSSLLCIGQTKRRDEPGKGRFQLGLGCARVCVDGKDVFMAHFTRGLPIRISLKPNIYRGLVLFAESTETVKKFINEALLWKQKVEEKRRVATTEKFVLCTLRKDFGVPRWRNHGLKPTRCLNTIFLKQGIRDAIMEDVNSFLEPSTKEWYLNHGVPYRRSHLYYGPPGGGKTSLIRAMAGALKLTACFLDISTLTNRELQDGLDGVPRRSIVVIEDIDVMFDENRLKKQNSLVTFSGMLNTLDGLVSSDGLLTVMTTNHIGRIDPALIRAGRVDRRFEFEAPNRDMLKRYFKSFYPDADEEMGKSFADIVVERREISMMSIATLQQHFVHTRNNTAQECLDLLPEFFADLYANEPGGSLSSIYD